MYDVKLGSKIFRGVKGVGMFTETNETVIFRGNQSGFSVAAQQGFDENVVLDFRNVNFAEIYTVE